MKKISLLLIFFAACNALGMEGQGSPDRNQDSPKKNRNNFEFHGKSRKLQRNGKKRKFRDISGMQEGDPEFNELYFLRDDEDIPAFINPLARENLVDLLWEIQRQEPKKKKPKSDDKSL